MAKQSPQNRLYWSRVYSGLCTRCGASLAENARYKLCDICRDRAKMSALKFRSAGKTKAKRRDFVNKNKAKPNSITEIVRYAKEHGVSYGIAVAYLDGRIKELPK